MGATPRGPRRGCPPGLRENAGFTLVEVVVAAAILFGVVAGFTYLFGDVWVLSTRDRERSRLREDLQWTLQRISDGWTVQGTAVPGLRSAREVDTGPGELVFVAEGVKVSYYLDDGRLWVSVSDRLRPLRVETAGARPVLGQVQDFSVRDDSVTVTLALTAEDGRGASGTLSLAVSPRNR